MEKIKKTLSVTQKTAQKNYDKKTKMVSIKYNLSDMDEYRRLKNYLADTGQSANGFIKALINNFFESEQDIKKVDNIYQNPLEKKRNIKEEYYPCSWIEAESIQFFLDKFGQKLTDEIINEYIDNIKFQIDDIVEQKGCGFDNWGK